MTPKDKLKRYIQAKHNPALAMMEWMEQADSTTKNMVEKAILEAINQTRQTFEQNIAELSSEFDRTVKALFKEIPSLQKEIYDKLMGEMSEKMEANVEKYKGINGKPGRNADETIIVQKVLQLIPPTKMISREEVESIADTQVSLFFEKNKHPSKEDIKKIAVEAQKKFVPEEFAEPMARAFEKLKGKDKLDYNALKNRPIIPAQQFGGVIHRGGGGLSVLTATGSIDDSNVTFVFTSTPTLVVVNGAIYQNGSGVTISGITATLDNPAGTGGSVFGLG